TRRPCSESAPSPSSASCALPGPPCRTSSGSRSGASRLPTTRYHVRKPRNGRKPSLACKRLRGPAPEAAAKQRHLAAGPDCSRSRGEVLRGQTAQLIRVELLEPDPCRSGEPQRLRVQRLLEDRAGVARIAEALAALGLLEDAAQLPGCVAGQAILVLLREAAGNRDQLLARI